MYVLFLGLKIVVYEFFNKYIICIVFKFLFLCGFLVLYLIYICFMSVVIIEVNVKIFKKEIINLIVGWVYINCRIFFF